MIKVIQFCILAIASLTVMSNSAIAPALGGIADEFSSTSLTTIRLLLTVPTLFIIPSTFLAGHLVKRFPIKVILIIGLTIYSIGGVGGAFCVNLVQLFSTRALLGIGVGLIMPLTTTIVAELYEGNERTKMMGRVSAANSFGAAISLVACGWLASVEWKYSFLVYILGFLVLIFNLLFLPNVGVTLGNSKRELPQQIFSKNIYLWALGMFLLFIVFYSIPTNIDFLIEDLKIGNSQTSGIVISIGTITGFIAGVYLNLLIKTLKTFFIPFQLFMLCLGFLLLSKTNNLITVIIGVGVIGFAVGALIPIIFDRVANTQNKESIAKSMAIISSAMYAGQFLSPLMIDYFANLLFFKSVQEKYFMQAIIVSILIVTILLINLMKKTPLYKKAKYNHKSTIRR
ncbi:MFS transporter [Priestia megaterium]|uniref:MFS transporter n=1 Tax=Priestia megaterium TaxID=1404 RepID=UPI0025AF5A4E|nr:MFS transporter [Priestia megaterium]MDN3233366.1 MFS transporter [Priestia megaterium]